MSNGREIASLQQLLDEIEGADQQSGRVFLGQILELLQERSFGPILLVAGLATLAPLVGDIPGVPTILGILVMLVGAQMLFGRKRFWLPRWLLRRSVSREKLSKAIRWLRTPARFVDRLLKPRLTLLTRGLAARLIAAASIFISAWMPVMELVPFSANIAGFALATLGLSLIARDGLLLLLAVLATIAAAGLVGYSLL